MVSIIVFYYIIIILYYNINILWDHHHIGSLSLTECHYAMHDCNFHWYIFW